MPMMSYKIERIDQSNQGSSLTPKGGSTTLISSGTGSAGMVSGKSQLGVSAPTVSEHGLKKDLEWVTVLITDLKRAQDKEFAQHLLTFIGTQMEKNRSKLDPKEFRTLYINKNYSNTDFQGSQAALKKNKNISISISMMSSHQGNSNSIGMTGSGIQAQKVSLGGGSSGGGEGTSSGSF